MPKKVLWRLLIWLVLMGYMALDFLVLKGPLHQKLKTKEATVLPDAERGIAARVFHKPVYLSQIDYAVDKMLWTKGRKIESVSESELTYLRQVAIRDIADQYILRTKLVGQEDDYPISDEEISAAVQRFSARFASKDELVNALKANGIKGDKELRYRLAAKLQQDLYIKKFTQPDPKALAEEAQKAYQEYQDQFSIPERLKVRHIFCAKLENTRQEALIKLRIAMVFLNLSYQSEYTFTELAEVLSEDERTKRNSGDLGWIKKNRIAPDFTEAVFAAEVGKPKIIETKLGWHLVLVTAKELPKPRSYDEMKAEIMLGLENYQRKNNIEKFRISLRKQQADKIKIDWDMLKKPWTGVKVLEKIK